MPKWMGVWEILNMKSAHESVLGKCVQASSEGIWYLEAQCDILKLQRDLIVLVDMIFAPYGSINIVISWKALVSSEMLNSAMESLGKPW